MTNGASGPRRLAPHPLGGRRNEWVAAALRLRWRNRFIWFGAFLTITGLLTRLPHHDAPQLDEIDRAHISDREIRAAFDFKAVDLAATHDAREKAAAAELERWRIDRATVLRQLDALRTRCEWIAAHRTALEKAILGFLRDPGTPETLDARIERAISAAARDLKSRPEYAVLPDEAILAQWLTPDLAFLNNRRPSTVWDARTLEGDGESLFAPETPSSLTFSRGDTLAALSEHALEEVLSRGLRAAKPVREDLRIVLEGRMSAEDSGRNTEMLLADVMDLQQAEETLNGSLIDQAKQAAAAVGQPESWAALHSAALAMTRPLLTGTVFFDQLSTADARKHAREATPEEVKEIYAGQIIQDRGKPWTAQSRSDVKTYARLASEQPGERVLASLLAHALLAAMVLLGLLRIFRLFRDRNTLSRRTQANIVLLLLCGLLAVGRAVSYFEPSGLIVPFAAAGILCAILTNGRLAVVVSAFSAVLVSAQYNYDWRLLFVSGAMSLAGVLGVFKVRRRGDMSAASIAAAGAGLAATAAISLAIDPLQHQAPLWTLLSSEALRERLVLIALNGGLCLMLVPALLSPLERFFGVTTDIQLLEYSDLNNELLSQLARKAGPTYSHSQVVGQLASAAADAVGANGLLAKVCAYYHDIGKMLRSEYFTENQSGHNVHDDLPPRLSARAIVEHVLQGAELAREYHLPKPIVDGILEHHGTTLIGFFHQRAKEQQKGGEVREEDFRYPGPKPQRPETAILMICDAVESGVRSMPNPDEQRVREFAGKVIASRVADRQFDECDLTLKQLDTIADVVTKQIMTSLHTRVAYPEPKDGVRADNVMAMPGKS